MTMFLATRPADPQHELSHTLLTAASLMAAAALVDRAGADDVSITARGTDISIQVPQHNGDETTRADTVAAYALVLDVPVRRNPGTQHAWIEAHGVIGAHRVHVWTIADASTPVMAVVS